MTLPFALAARVTRARVLEESRAPAEVSVTTDTRSLQPGQTFLALRGERFDGHEFLTQAVAAGASAIVIDVNEVPPGGVATLVVDDTLAAYMALAAAARDRFSGRVVGVTGSVGKTTTKVFLAQLLALQRRPLASPANENNEIGVAKLLLEASNDEHDVLVVEMGARKFGDVAALVDIARPDVGVLTNVGDAHIEIMGSRQRLEETKWALFSHDASAILNLSDETSRRRAATLSGTPHWFFAGDREPQLPEHGALCAIIRRDELLVVDEASRRKRRIDVRVPGAHNRSNLAAAIACALDLGVALDAIVAALPFVTLPQGRFERVEAHGLHLIYDAYNASASGTIASLDAFADEPARERIVVLGGMAELGDEAEALHERVGARAAAVADWVLAGGPFSGATARGAADAGLARERIVEYATNHEAAEWLRKHAQHDDLVLLKGSRMYQLEEIVEELRAP